MKLKKREPSGREKNEETIELLERLREQVYSENPSAARHAAFHLSWMQEDGFDILKEALNGHAQRTTKSAAAYGLRKMRGRMKKQAISLLEEGLKHSTDGTRQVCTNALRLLREAKQPAPLGAQQRSSGQQKRPKPKFRISEITPYRTQGNASRYGRRNPPQSPRFNR
ncbi:MAG: hypothetical protein JW749_07905 [Sedimentisphaerales bacterium]|nr:hypothetical protein [Sedimentisphaerales bacterium]